MVHEHPADRGAMATLRIYVARDPRAIAQTRGIDQPFTVLLTLLDRLLRLQRSVAWVPLGVTGLRAVIAALHEWQRKSELSCDRAGLLTGQDPQAALRAHPGGPRRAG